MSLNEINLILQRVPPISSDHQNQLFGFLVQMDLVGLNYVHRFVLPKVTNSEKLFNFAIHQYQNKSGIFTGLHRVLELLKISSTTIKITDEDRYQQSNDMEVLIKMHLLGIVPKSPELDKKAIFLGNLSIDNLLAG